MDPLKGEWFRDEAQHQGALRAGRFGKDRGGTAAGATSQPCNDDDKVGTPAKIGHHRHVLLGCLAPGLGVTPGGKPTITAGTELTPSESQWRSLARTSSA